MRRIMSKIIKVLLVSIFMFLNITIIFSLSVKENVEKGDIYNSQENKVGSFSIINANNGLDSTSPGFVEVQKIVTKSNNKLGEYNVEFKIRGNNTTVGVETVKPVYVVIVLDASNSMDKPNKWESAKKAVEDFTTELLNKIPTANIALIKFAGRSINDNWQDAEVKRFFKNEKITSSSIGDVKVNDGGATNLGEGLRQAYRLLNNEKVPSDNSTLYKDSDYIKVEQESSKYVVILSDGVPTLYTDEKGKSINSKESNYATRYCTIAYNSSLNWANKLKELGSEIFTIGYELDKIEWTKDRNKAYELLNKMATKEDFVIKDSNVSDIVNKFKSVTSKIELEFNPGTKVKITDKLGDAFTLLNGDTTLKLDKITSSWTSLGSFNILIDENIKEGWYPTNDGFKVTYKDYNNNIKEINSNINPEVYWKEDEYKYTINYYFDNNLDNLLSQLKSAKLNSIIYVNDNYLSDEDLNNKNNADNKIYFIDPSNVSNSSKITITNNEKDNILNIYYIFREFKDEYINKNADIDKLTSSNMSIKYNIDYGAKINNVNKNDKLKTVIIDYLPYEIDLEKSNLNGGIYNKEEKSIIFTFEEVIDEYKTSYDVSKNIEYYVVYKNIENIKPLVNSVNGYSVINDMSSSGVVDEEKIDVEIMGNVCAIYIEENTGNKLLDDNCIRGLVGDNYQTEYKDIFGYELVKEPINNSGKFKEEDIHLKYIYRKSKGIIDHTVTKEGDLNVNSINDYFNYNINVNASVKEYIGNVKLKVIDILPYKIDLNNSILDDRCVLSSDYEITCLIDYGEINQKNYNEDEEYNINEIFKFKLSFIDIDLNTVINNSLSYVILDNNIDKKNDYIITNIPYGETIVNYVNKNNEKLTHSLQISNLVGTSYETQKKVFNDYYLVDIKGNEEGIISKDITEVTYVYDITPLPPHTGIMENNSYIKYFIIICLLLMMYKLRKRV